ncbi:hypothetical protein KSZ_43580 [Dictyobacter formicarum]|uniref:Uncharacterized protein n=1 Tax=Dictyobacter formicarum TaxID=2778368 RepID=A0ABQ3VJG7_9CHLR|nr:hypothetical protein KSZ_43580 [Dictyobacter formicarum]
MLILPMGRQDLRIWLHLANAAAVGLPPYMMVAMMKMEMAMETTIAAIIEIYQSAALTPVTKGAIYFCELLII